MNSLRNWIFKPKRCDKSYLAQFYYANEELNEVASELDSFDGRKEPERCHHLVTKLRNCQDAVLTIVEKIMTEIIPNQRAPRDFRVKFPEEVSQENLAGQLWFGAECLAAGSSIQHREIESASMRPLARTVTNHIDRLRTLLRDQCLRDPNSYSNRIRRALIEFDQSFAEFELSYVSAMVTVKTMKEYDQLQEVTVLFCETVQRALRLEYLSLETIESFDPELMITIPRLAIVCGLLIYPDGPVNPDLDPTVMCHMFRPFQILLFKIRELLWTMNSKELRLLELALCSCEETPGLAAAQLSRLNSCEGSSSQAAAHLSRLNICEGSSSQAAAQLSRLNSYEGSSSQAAAKLSRLSSCEVSSSQATAQLPHLGRRDDAAQAAVRFSSEEPFIHAAATTQLSQPSNVEALNFSAVPQSCVDSLQSNSLVNFDDDRPCDAMEPENSKANESQGARRLDNSQGAGILSESSLGNNDDLVTENSTEHRDFRSCMSSIVRTDAEIEETSTTLTNYSIDTNNEGDLNTASSQNSSFSEAEPSNLTVDLVNESQGDHCTDEMLPSVSDDNGMSATGSCVVNNISCNNEHYESELIDRASDGCSQNCDTELNGEVSRNLGNNDNGLNINRNVNVLNDSNSQLIENASETLAEIVSNLSSSDVAEIIINSELSDEIPAENSLEIHRNVRHCDVNKYRCNGVRDCRSDVEVACLETSPELTTNIIRNKISLFVCNELERNRVMNELSTLDGYIVRTGNNASDSESQILLDFEDPSLVSSCDRNNTDCSDINSVPSNSLAINDFSNGSTTESNQVTSNEPLNADDGLTSESLQNADELIDQRPNSASAMPNCSEFDASASEKSIGVADYSDSVLNALATSEIRDSVTDNVTLDEGRAPMRLVTDFMSHRVRDEGGRVVHGGGADVVEVSTSVTSQYSTDTSNTVCAHSDGSCWSIETSTDESEDEDRRVHLAIQAAGAASRHEARSHFRNSSDLIHRLFVCISGVADQLQTNHASDLRHILQRVFEYSMTSEENSESTEETVSQVTAGLSPSSEEQGQDLADDTADTGNSEVQNVSDCDNGLLVRRDGGLMTLVQGQGHQVNERSGNAGQGQSPTRPGNLGQGQSPARSGNIGQSPVSSESLGQGQSPVRSGVVGQGQNPTRSENIDLGQSPIRSPGVSHVEGHLDHVPGRGVLVPEGGGRGDEEWSDSDCSLAEDALVALGGESASDLEYSTSVTSGASVSDGGELLIAPQWLSDDTIRSCMNCRGSFSFIRRRHHCRHCGKIFCAQCSSNQIALPQFGHNKPVRVCDQCFFFRLSPFTLHSSS